MKKIGNLLLIKVEKVENCQILLKHQVRLYRSVIEKLHKLSEDENSTGTANFPIKPELKIV